MTTPFGEIPRPQTQRLIRETNVSFAFGYVQNGIIVPVNDAPRDRMGKKGFPFYVDKIQGYEAVQTVTGATGGGKGGIIYANPDTTASNRTKLIFAHNNVVRMYIIDSDTLVTLRDIGTIDSQTITFLSGTQAKKNAYFVIGDADVTTSFYKYTGTSTGAITAFADYGGTVAGTVKVTDVGHGMQTGNTVTIAGTTSYNGTFVITKIDADNFYITATWVADDATGTWTGETLTKETGITALLASRLISSGDNRLTSVGIGASADINQYSKLNEAGIFTDFTSSTDSDGGGRWSGNIGDTTALLFSNGFQLVAERDRISVHSITLKSQDTGLLKEVKTIQDNFGIEGAGTSSARGIIDVNGLVYFVDARGAVFEWNIKSGKLTEITKKFRPFMKGLGFDSSAIGYDAENDLLLVTASTLKNSVQDRILVYNLVTKTWTIDTGKSVNQFFYDNINKQMYGTASATNEIQKIFDGSYLNDQNNIELIAETELYDGSLPYVEKEYVSTSIEVGGQNATQSINMKIFIDQNDGESLSNDFSFDGRISVGQGTSGSWAGTSWAGGSTPSSSELQFLPIFSERLVPDFQRIAIRFTESSGYRAVFNVPEITYNASDFPSHGF